MPARAPQLAVGIGVLVLGGAIAVGAAQISSQAGYSGVGPNFLPWVAAVLLALCGALLLRQAWTGGFRDREVPGTERGDWHGFAWMSAGILLDAALITRIGFILACTLCFVLAARGLRISQGRPGWSVRTIALDAAIGFAISAPVFWMFGQALGINLPALTSTGWL